jgi:F-type H+-transporting ATPase subunit b
MIEIDATFIALVALIIFGLLMLVLKVPSMIAGMLDSQSQAIARELAEARRLREEAERLLAHHQAQMDQAKTEAEALVAAAKEQAKALGAEARVTLADSIARRQKQAEDRIAQAESHATAQVRAAAADAAIAAAEKTLRAQINADVQTQLVTQSAAELARKFG